jgi:hypothetical protein
VRSSTAGAELQPSTTYLSGKTLAQSFKQNQMVFLDYQVFLAQTKKASVLEIERKFVLFLKNKLCYFIFFLHLVTLKFIVARQTCRPSRAEKGLKDWAILTLCTGLRVGVLRSLCTQSYNTKSVAKIPTISHVLWTSSMDTFI